MRDALHGVSGRALAWGRPHRVAEHETVGGGSATARSMLLSTMTLLGILAAEPSASTRGAGVGLGISAGVLGSQAIALSILGLHLRKTDGDEALREHFEPGSTWNLLGPGNLLTLPVNIMSPILTLGATGLAIGAGVRGGRGHVIAARRRTALVASGATLAGFGVASYIASLTAPLAAHCERADDLDAAYACNARAFLPTYPLAGLGIAAMVTGTGLLSYGLATSADAPPTLPTVSFDRDAVVLGATGRF